MVLTLALGIGANAAIFTLVRGVLLRPLVNRDENRLIYIRQSAPGLGTENAVFSVPEMQDLRQRVKSLSAIGDFSTIGFTLNGLGEPREVRAGVVGGNYFDVMGLHPVLGRLLDMRDDGPAAAGAVVLTYRFWTTALKSDPSVLGKVVRLESFGPRTATIVGVLEPSIPYPAETEIIANVVTSPHHLSATMVTGRVHRMTELFGRLAPGATLEQARAELKAAHAAIMKEHPEAYPAKADFRIDAMLLRDQITSKARTVLWVLLAASGLVFIIACSNVANLILARTIRREGELVIRAALGASTAALRRVLLAESLLLCGAGAALGVLSARPMVAILARYASRFSVRALDLTVDSSMLWVGAGLALVAAALLAFVPRLPSGDRPNGISLSSGSVRMTGGATRRLRAFAVTQIAASFVLLAGAAMLLKTLLALQAVQTGIDTRRVLAINVPVISYGRTDGQVVDFYKEAMRRVHQLPGVDGVALGMLTPWREGGTFGPGFQFTAEGYVRATAEDDPRGQFRIVSPGFFAALGVPMIAGRDFNDLDRKDSEPVAIVSQSVAQRMFPNQEALNRHVIWTDPVIKFIGMKPTPMRIVGIAADIDDEHLVPQPTLTVYHPVRAGTAFRRAPLRPRAIGSVCSGQPDHADHPRPLGGPAGGARRDAGRCPRGGADAGPFERHGFRRLRPGGADDCGGGRGGRAGIFGERADARIRHPAGDRIAAAASAGAGDRGGHGHHGVWELAPDWRAGSRCSGWPAVISRTCECRGRGWWLGRRAYCWQRPWSRPRGRRCEPRAWM